METAPKNKYGHYVMRDMPLELAAELLKLA
jgi:hypothetical protein